MLLDSFTVVNETRTVQLRALNYYYNTRYKNKQNMGSSSSSIEDIRDPDYPENEHVCGCYPEFGGCWMKGSNDEGVEQRPEFFG